MKVIFLTLLLFTTISLSAQWRIKFDGTDPDNEVKSVSFISPSTGYIATQKWIGFTTDSGQTVQKRFVTLGNVNWNNNPVNLTFGFSVEDIHAFSADTLVISGDYGLEPSILYSTNGGANWLLVFHRQIPFNTVNIFNSMWQMEFPGRGSIGFAVHGDQVLKTSNRGQTWQVVRLDANQELFDITFPTQQTGFAAGPNRLLKTSNGGSSWSILNVPFSTRELVAYSDQYVFVNTTNGDSYYSSNGGANWTQSNAPVGQIFTDDLHYVNDSTGYALAGGIFQTRNRGKSWELMTGTENMHGIYKLRFWDKDLAWACTYAEDLLITTNGGGISRPRALFTVNSSMVCTNNTIQLVNQSHSGYTYQWFRKDVLFASTYHASYTASAAPEYVKLVVSNGTQTDTLVEYVDAIASAALKLNSALRYDTVCSNGTAVFDIFNSRTDVQYQIGRIGGGFATPVYGNGGTLTLYGGIGTNDDSVIYSVSAYLNGDCGVQRDDTTYILRVIQSNPPAGTVQDTICTQNPFMITVTNTRAGYQYWADPGFPKVNGNGGTIQVPCRLEASISNFNLEGDGTLVRHIFPIYAQHASTGCGGDMYVAQAIMIGRRTIANFEVLGHEWMTGTNLAFTNKSKRGESWLWRFPDGGNAPTSTMGEPNNISYTSNGAKVVKLVSRTLEGCVDSATRTIEIFTSTNTVPGENICPGPAGNFMDTLKGDRQYFVSRSIYEDEYGSRIVTGGYTDMRYMNDFYPTGYEGWFAAKFEKNGAVKWSIRQSGGEDYFTYNQNSHIIMEQAIGDSLGYTYLFGHSLNRRYISVNGTDRFNIPRNGSFLVCISPEGNILWVKSLHNRQAFSDETLADYNPGTILRGKSGDIYVVTHRHPGGRYFVNNTQLLSYTEGVTGVILQFDRRGNIKRFRNYPITEDNKRRFEIYSGNSYDTLAKAKWGPNGKLVIYGQLNQQEMGGNSIDGVPVTFDMVNIKNSLLFFDTANLQVTAIKPVFRNTSSGPTGMPLQTFAVDDNGNYFASYNIRRFDVPPSSLAYSNDTTKPTTFISGFNAAGTLLWTKQSEGLEPKSMEVHGGLLKLAGINYNSSGFTNGAMIYFSNQSPTLHTVKKLTLIGDANTYSGVGTYGLGSIDLMVASMDPSNGAVRRLQPLGTQKEDEYVTMSKGYGEQLWMAGTVGTTTRNVINWDDTTTTIHTYKIAADNNCLATYKVLPPYVQLDLRDLGTNCVDSTYKLYWSSHAAGSVNLSFSLNNGLSYIPLVTGVPASNGYYSFNVPQAGTIGSVLFKIEDPANALVDTARAMMEPRVAPVVTITASDTLICSNKTVNFTANPTHGGSAPVYQWWVNNQFAGNNANFSWSNFTNGTQVKVIMISNHGCVTKQRDTSELFVMQMPPTVTASVSISGTTTVTQGQSTLITATGVNGGTVPTWQWQDSTAAHGWQNITNATSSTHNYIPAATGDKIRCVMTSKVVCASPASPISPALSFTVNAITGVDPTPASDYGIRVYPNPASGFVIIDTLSLADRWETLEIVSSEGKRTFMQMNIRNKQRVTVNTWSLPTGMYVVILTRKGGTRVYMKFVRL